MASDHLAASAAGVAALQAGGNAIDAACATALALGVANPQSSGIGGGGFALVYLAKTKKVYAVDFREQAPSGLTPDRFVRNGKADIALSTRGGLAVGVPGEVRGLSSLVKRWGKRSWAECVEPAQHLAEGVAATDHLVEAVHGLETRDPALVPQVLTYQAPLHAGDRIRRPALARTLAQLRKEGPEAFYRGPIADRIVAAVQAGGGVMTRADLAGYAALDRTPIESTFRGQRIWSMPPPSSGGIVVAEVLGILSALSPDLSTLGAGSSAYLHLLAEAMKHAFADRARQLGDADFVAVPLRKLTDPAYHRLLANRIRPDGVLDIAAYGSPGAATTGPRDGGTAHLSVIDAEGNAVALTTTVNLSFGAHLVAGETGIVLNNQMDDFSLQPGVPNAFGLVGSAQNAVAPGKRPLSSMSPTLVLDDHGVRMAVGGAGGPTIISGTLQVLLNVLEFKMDAQAASAAPRIHHQWQPNVLSYETEIPKDVTDALVHRGHSLARRGHIATVNIVVRTQEGLEAAAEFRSGGGPAGY